MAVLLRIGIFADHDASFFRIGAANGRQSRDHLHRICLTRRTIDERVIYHYDARCVRNYAGFCGLLSSPTVSALTLI